MGERNIDELIDKKEWMLVKADTPKGEFSHQPRCDHQPKLLRIQSMPIRPCLLYQEEYKDCRSLASRFHQKFVFGSVIDCSQWKRDYDNCVRWTEKQDKRSFVELINSEESRRKERLDAHYGNDVWEKRVSPPPGWNDPLPPWIEEKIKNSYLTLKAQDVKNEKERTFCVIS